jgi:hypothetical protein
MDVAYVAQDDTYPVIWLMRMMKYT